MLRLFEKYGFLTSIEQYYVMLSYPINRIVEVVSPPEKKFKCSLKEEVKLIFFKKIQIYI